MKYRGCALGQELELSVEREGLRLGSRFVDYAALRGLRPVNHRVLLFLQSGEQIEISMLGFSYDGFWEELTGSFGARSLEALFVDETRIMACEGEYELPGERGRAEIALYPDAICILPPNCSALRIPLFCTSGLWLDGYMPHILLETGESYCVGRMGYDTRPFAERAAQAADRVKKERARALAALPLQAPFTEKGLFRTKRPEQFWNAAFGRGCCALELFAGEDAATYLYRFSEPRDLFLQMLAQATEAVGTHRELICLSDEQLAEKPLYQMAVQRSAAVRFLRSRAAGRLIHSANHAQRLREFLA